MAHPGGPASPDAEAGVGVTDMLLLAAQDGAGLRVEEEALEEEDEEDEEEEGLGSPRLLELLLSIAPTPGLGGTTR